MLTSKLAKGEMLKEVNFKNKTFVAEFSSLSAATINAIEKELKTANLGFKSSKQSESWRVEVAL
jgi:ribosome recycling factor